MRLRVDEIPESGRLVHIHWDEDKLGQFIPPDDPFELRLVRPVNVDLEINRRSDHIRVEGAIHGLLRVICHRCLEPFTWHMDEEVDVYLMQEPRVEPQEEMELEAEDLDCEFFDGEVIEIDQLIAEQIFLSLPFKVLCSEDCLGLCPHCGANLNNGPCTCSTDASNSSFSKLAALKSQLPTSSDG
jgi:uncharacterized protein